MPREFVPCLGLTFGNVIIDHLVGGTSSTKVPRRGGFKSLPPVPGVFEGLKVLQEQIFKGNMFVVHKPTDATPKQIKAWMTHHNFYEAIGIPESRVYPIRTANDIMVRSLSHPATHFVDAKLEVLSVLVNKIRKLYAFRPRGKDLTEFRLTLNHAPEVQTWDEIVALVVHQTATV